MGKIKTEKRAARKGLSEELLNNSSEVKLKNRPGCEKTHRKDEEEQVKFYFMPRKVTWCTSQPIRFNYFEGKTNTMVKLTIKILFTENTQLIFRKCSVSPSCDFMSCWRMQFKSLEIFFCCTSTLKRLGFKMNFDVIAFGTKKEMAFANTKKIDSRKFEPNF